MEHKIVTAPKRKLVGIKIETSLSESKTAGLWQNFRSRVNEIKNRANNDYFSVQIYPKGQSMDTFTPITNFEKWAAVEVSDFQDLPDGMEELEIGEGKYAVFKHRGIATDFFRTSQYIFGTWLPSSGFELDDRPHFEIMTENYQGPEDPNSEEDVYIPLAE